jgi:signal transduction histidine kinase
LKSYSALHVYTQNAFSDKLTKFLENNVKTSVETANSVHQAMDRLTSKSYDAIISSYEMNDEGNLDFLLHVKKSKMNVPFIMYANRGNEHVAVNALNLGADGYVINTGDFDATIANLFHQINIVLEKYETSKELEKVQNQQKKILLEMELANADLERFAYIASHDLQEPLRMVTSYLQLIEKRYKNKLDSDADEFIDFAVKGAQRMKELIDDILTYSRSGRNSSKPISIDASKVLTEVERNLVCKINERHVQITHDELPSLVMSHTDLTQLFQNLIENAIKYSKNEPKIHVSSKMKEGSYLFAITDNGIGIDPAQYNQLFQLFRRLHNKDQYSGSGIGLAVCKKIVQKYHGKIWIDSQVGKGSTFYFTINNEVFE